MQLVLASHHNPKAYYIDQNELLQEMINRYVNKIDSVPLNNWQEHTYIILVLVTDICVIKTQSKSFAGKP